MPDQPDPDLSTVIAGEDATPQPPPVGSPTLCPAASLPRLLRAEFFDKVRGVDLARLDNIGEEMKSAPLDVVADVFGMFAKMQTALRVVAVSKDGFDQWAKSVSDDAVMDLFLWYFSEMFPGEAQPSAT